MNFPGSKTSSFFREIKRRKVVRTCVLYILMCWGVLQVGDIIFPALEMNGDTASRVLLYLAIGGFPVTLTVAWFFQITSDGIVRTEPFVERRVLSNIPPINDRRRESWFRHLINKQKRANYDWILSAETGPLAGLSFGISEPILMGRSLDCELTIISAHMSRHHARLDFIGDQLMIEDLESANGTLVNGKPIEHRQPLKHQDEIRFHDIVFRVTESFSHRRSEQEAMNKTTFINASDMELDREGQ